MGEGARRQAEVEEGGELQLLGGLKQLALCDTVGNGAELIAGGLEVAQLLERGDGVRQLGEGVGRDDERREVLEARELRRKRRKHPCHERGSIIRGAHSYRRNAPRRDATRRRDARRRRKARCRIRVGIGGGVGVVGRSGARGRGPARGPAGGRAGGRVGAAPSFISMRSSKRQTQFHSATSSGPCLLFLSPSLPRSESSRRVSASTAATCTG